MSKWFELDEVHPVGDSDDSVWACTRDSACVSQWTVFVAAALGTVVRDTVVKGRRITLAGNKSLCSSTGSGFRYSGAAIYTFSGRRVFLLFAFLVSCIYFYLIYELKLLDKQKNKITLARVVKVLP